MEHGFSQKKKNGVVYTQVPRFSKIGGISHGFTTRIGGVSRGDFATLNIGIRRPDEKSAVMENLRRSVEAVGGHFENLVISHQKHTTVIRVVDASCAGEGARGEEDTPVCDALVTNVPNIPLLTYYADCTPVALYDPQKRVIAAVHAGWRGTVQKIAYQTVLKMGELYGTDPSDIVGAVGPSIGPCCFEIGPEVAREFPPEYVKKSPTAPQKFYADLWRYNADQLKEAGLLDENITLSEECTVCRSDRYFSNRAQRGYMGNHGLIMELKA